jgi:transglutaminase-like putative cysteine protease
VTRRVIAREAAATGRPPSYAVEETMDVMPTPSRLVVDADGRVVEETMPGPFGDVRVVAATAAVRDRVAGGGPLPEELFSRALVRANVRLPEPRAIERLRVRIDLRRPQAGFPELEGPYQHVLERGADHVVLEVSRAPAGGPDGPADAGAAYTEPNFILQSDHPDVVALARSLRHPGAGPYAQARALQDWAAEHMRFDAGLAMLPASEVVRDRGGTCVAYSVLLASLARALGIPARIVMGYVYVANVWGGHAWTEIRAGGRWIPLDAAVYRAGPADAARIALVRHSGEQGAASGAAELGRLFGNESIRILGYRVGARWVEVPAGAAPYRIDGDRYRNPWLGLSVQRPPGFAFAKADSSYPDLTVIALDGPDGSEIRLRQSGARSAGFGPGAWLAAEGYGTGANGARVAGHAALRGTAASRAALAFRDGADLWLLEAEGAAARRRLDEVAGHLVLRRVRAAAALAHGAGGR